jgi:hypothetical protein
MFEMSVEAELKAISQAADALHFLRTNQGSNQAMNLIVGTLENRKSSPLANAVGKAMREVLGAQLHG